MAVTEVVLLLPSQMFTAGAAHWQLESGVHWQYGSAGDSTLAEDSRKRFVRAVTRAGASNQLWWDSESLAASSCFENAS
jgi:hypothetical protein